MVFSHPLYQHEIGSEFGLININCTTKLVVIMLEYQHHKVS